MVKPIYQVLLEERISLWVLPVSSLDPGFPPSLQRIGYILHHITVCSEYWPNRGRVREPFSMDRSKRRWEVISERVLGCSFFRAPSSFHANKPRRGPSAAHPQNTAPPPLLCFVATIQVMGAMSVGSPDSSCTWRDQLVGDPHCWTKAWGQQEWSWQQQCPLGAVVEAQSRIDVFWFVFPIKH